MSTLFRDARLADGRVRDVRTASGRIASVAESVAADPPDRVVDADERLLLPGAIDAHVHFREPGHSQKETWRTGSRSAAAGGVTTVVDQPNTTPPTVTGDAFDEKLSLAADSHVDYGVNGGVTPDWDPDSLFDRPLFALGEVFLADSTGDMGIDADLFAEAVERAAEADVVVTVHAEDADLFDETARERDADAGDRPDALADGVVLSGSTAGVYERRRTSGWTSCARWSEASSTRRCRRSASASATSSSTPRWTGASNTAVSGKGSRRSASPTTRSSRRSGPAFRWFTAIS